MFKWKDKVYVNARKRVFKNLDTNEILNLELQDDEDNIVTDSDTPLSAYCLNQAQQELVDDMSKIYMGMNITADTVEGIGRINKVYGKTTEVGTGEKSPTNPYMLECVGDDVNLFDGIFENGDLNSANGSNEVNNNRIRTKNHISVTAGSYIIIANNPLARVIAYDTNKNFVKYMSVSNNAFTIDTNVKYIRFSFNTTDLNTKAKLCKNTVASPYSPYRFWYSGKYKQKWFKYKF